MEKKKKLKRRISDLNFKKKKNEISPQKNENFTARGKNKSARNCISRLSWKTKADDAKLQRGALKKKKRRNKNEFIIRALSERGIVNHDEPA